MNSIAQTSSTGESDPLPGSSNQNRSGSTSNSAAISATTDGYVIPEIADPAAYQANMAAIDCVIVTRKYLHIVAWGKWLGFTPKAVLTTVELAIAEDAPIDAIQKIGDRWLRLADIQNESNRCSVDELARESEVMRPAGQISPTRTTSVPNPCCDSDPF